MPDLAEQLSLSQTDASIGFRALADDCYLTVSAWVGSGVLGMAINPRLGGKGRRAIGQWPADPYAELVTVLKNRIDVETDAPRRGRLERLLDAIGEVGQGVATSVITDVVKRTAGL
jgi:hypothetical protein